jgi:hypothetical protein
MSLPLLQNFPDILHSPTLDPLPFSYNPKLGGDLWACRYT